MTGFMEDDLDLLRRTHDEYELRREYFGTSDDDDTTTRQHLSSSEAQRTSQDSKPWLEQCKPIDKRSGKPRVHNVDGDQIRIKSIECKAGAGIEVTCYHSPEDGEGQIQEDQKGDGGTMGELTKQAWAQNLRNAMAEFNKWKKKLEDSGVVVEAHMTYGGQLVVKKISEPKEY